MDYSLYFDALRLDAPYKLLSPDMVFTKSEEDALDKQYLPRKDYAIVSKLLPGRIAEDEETTAYIDACRLENMRGLFPSATRCADGFIVPGADMLSLLCRVLAGEEGLPVSEAAYSVLRMMFMCFRLSCWREEIDAEEVRAAGLLADDKHKAEESAIKATRAFGSAAFALPHQYVMEEDGTVSEYALFEYDTISAALVDLMYRYILHGRDIISGQNIVLARCDICGELFTYERKGRSKKVCGKEECQRKMNCKWVRDSRNRKRAAGTADKEKDSPDNSSTTQTTENNSSNNSNN